VNVTEARNICLNANEYSHADLITAAHLLAETFNEAVEDAGTHCETCQNSEWSDECERATWWKE
jgi:hypothetical protein